ncbi:MAG: hypothetical protein AAF063_32880 [Cyanobacteria bacterium J06643_5]
MLDKDTFLLIINLVAFLYVGISSFLRISEQSSSKLTVTFRPILTLYVGFFFSNIAFLYLFGTFQLHPVHKIVCEHPTQNVSFPHINNTNLQKFSADCKLTDFDIFNREVSSKLISNVVEAKIEEKIEIDESNYEFHKYQIFLLTQNDSIPFGENVLMDNDIEEIKLLASSINIFLNHNKEKEVVGILDYKIVSYVGFGISLFFITIIFLIISSGLFIRFCFDKETNLLTVSRYRFLGILGKKVMQYSLDEITEIKTETIMGEESMRTQISVIVPDNKLLLTPKYSFSKSGNIGGIFSIKFKGEGYIARAIKDFLELN